MNDTATTSFIGRSMTRREDRRLLTGRGQFIADFELPHMLHAVFVRSPLAHAHIKAIDLVARRRGARRGPTRSAALNLRNCCRRCRTRSSRCRANGRRRSSTNSSTRSSRLLAHDKVRHVGEAVAVIVAESRYAAEDAAQLVTLDLDHAAGGARSRGGAIGGAPIVHDSFGTNLIGAFTIAKGDAKAAHGACAASAEAPLSSSPLCRHADGMPRCGRPVRIRAPMR